MATTDRRKPTLTDMNNLVQYLIYQHDNLKSDDPRFRFVSISMDNHMAEDLQALSRFLTECENHNIMAHLREKMMRGRG